MKQMITRLDDELHARLRSLAEGLTVRGFHIERCHARFLPYTMMGGPQHPLWMVAAYVRLPFLWRLRGEQFLVVARKPGHT